MRKLRARWAGPLPEGGDWLRSARPRFVYRIVFVTPLTGEFQLLLEVERHPVGAELVLGGTVHPWTWDSRGPKRGATAIRP